MKFKVGDRVRVICPQEPEAHRKEGTILMIIPNSKHWYTEKHQGRTAHIVDVDGVGTRASDMSEPECFGFVEEQLEPIIPLGSWDEIEKAIGFDIRERVPA